MREPLWAPTAALAAGVLAARLASLSFLESAVAAGLCAALALVGLRAPRPAAGLCSLLFGFGFAGAALSTSAPEPPPDRIDRLLADFDLELPVRLTGWVSEPPESLPDADRFTLAVESVFAAQPASGGVRITVNRPLEDPPLRLEYGERLELLARLRRPHNYGNPGAFDRVRYLRRRGVHMTATMRPYAPLLPLDGERGSRFQALLWNARRGVRERFEAVRDAGGLRDAESAAVLEASLLGDRGSLTRELENDFQRSGTYHALVVSGLHVGVLAGFLLWLLRRIGVRRWAAMSAAAAVAIAYALLLDTPLPAVRAAAMLSAYLAASLIYRAGRPLNVIAAAAFGFLAFDPDALLEPGFQLSFGAVTAIAVLAGPLLERWTVPHLQALRDLSNLDIDPHLAPEAAERRVAYRQVLEPLAALSRVPADRLSIAVRWCWFAVSTFVVSAVLLAALAVPTAAHFHLVAGASPLSNLVAIPLLACVVPLGFLAVLTGWPPLFATAAGAADALIWAARLGADGLALDRRVPPPPEWLAAATVAALVLWAIRLRRGWGAGAAAVAVLVLFGLIAVHPFPPDLSRDRMELTAIDVGQGDSLLLSAPPGVAVLIDAGGTPDFTGAGRPRLDVGDAVVAPYLRTRSIQRLHALAVTHADADHVGGAFAILDQFEVDELWLPAVEAAAFDALRSAAARRGARVRSLRRGDRLTVEEVVVDVLSPSPELTAARANDRSLALAATHGSRRFLLAGDLEAQGESAVAEQLGAYPGGVLKVAHHGSRTSSSETLLEKFRPAVAVASAGYDNLYRHPHAEALARLSAANVRLYRTDHDGLVSISTDGVRLFVETEALRQTLAPSAWSSSSLR